MDWCNFADPPECEANFRQIGQAFVTARWMTAPDPQCAKRVDPENSCKFGSDNGHGAPVLPAKLGEGPRTGEIP